MVSFLFRNISSYPDKPAMIDVSSGETLTFSQLKSMVAKVSHGLSRLGVSKGDVLLIVAPNLIHFPLCFLGTVALGAIASSSTVNEITKQARDCKPKLLVTVPEPWEKVKGLDLPAVILGPVEDRNLLSIVLVMRLGV
ncbi:Probable CoA ligase ccl7 [Dionaea muscipula]